MWATLALWRQRARERHQIMNFNEAMLHDIGISQIDALQEYRKPFWKP